MQTLHALIIVCGVGLNWQDSCWGRQLNQEAQALILLSRLKNPLGKKCTPDASIVTNNADKQQGTMNGEIEHLLQFPLSGLVVSKSGATEELSDSSLFAANVCSEKWPSNLPREKDTARLHFCVRILLRFTHYLHWDACNMKLVVINHLPSRSPMCFLVCTQQHDHIFHLATFHILVWTNVSCIHRALHASIQYVIL